MTYWDMIKIIRDRADRAIMAIIADLVLINREIPSWQIDLFEMTIIYSFFLYIL